MMMVISFLGSHVDSYRQCIACGRSRGCVISISRGCIGPWTVPCSPYTFAADANAMAPKGPVLLEDVLEDV